MKNLQQIHSFGLPSSARNIHRITHAEQAQRLAIGGGPRMVLGGGTNVVFTEHYDGDILLIKNEGFTLTEQRNGYELVVQAGHSWHQLVTETVRRGIGGLENLALIPGTVGAAPIQNIGAYGAEFKDVCRAVHGTFLTSGKRFQLAAEECAFGYRDSLFKRAGMQDAIITQVIIYLPKAWRPNIAYFNDSEFSGRCSVLEVFQRVVETRQRKLPDPNLLGNAGSFFKNPIVQAGRLSTIKQHYPAVPAMAVTTDAEPMATDAQPSFKIPAAWLIEQCGFKGKTQRGIGCYHQQPLVIVNSDPNLATGVGLLAFARSIQAAVWQKFAIKLENEVILMGKTGIVEL